MTERLRAGIVGLSAIASKLPQRAEHAGMGIRLPASHASAYYAVPETELVAACDLRPERAAAFKHQWSELLPDLRVYRDHREMLAAEDLDLVSVVTSDHVHAQVVVDAAAAGTRGILCEKPIATTLADADRMIAATEQAGIPMLVNHTRRWMSPWLQVAALIRDGTIGNVQRIVASQGGPRAMLFRTGTHICDSIAWFAGAQPQAVYALPEPGLEAYGPRYAGDGGRDPATDPALSVVIEFENGVRAFWNMCKTMPQVFDIDIYGEQGCIRGRTFPGDEISVTIDIGNHRLLDEPLARVEHTSGWFAGCVTELVGLVRHGGQPSSGRRQARTALEIMLAALQSQAQGGVRVGWPIADA
ncbi:MAG: Gfo/Idh/MocA family oxidoreductase [Chloroflexota bacterium]|nr:Gfo/Idh/MocA family oxidoreductase [Chloroflexota bacterium]MDE2896801.1 Gfo/Idh/MocA family oxidoreductase [Chloroflexota bacterium]